MNTVRGEKGAIEGFVSIRTSHHLTDAPRFAPVVAPFSPGPAGRAYVARPPLIAH